MFGLNLIHAGFLAGTLAVAVPVGIHLLFRRRARQVEIGTLRFLHVVLKDHAHRRKIRRWLLLALRAMALLLLALVFARPFLASPGSLGTDREVIFLVDQSASMSAGRGNRSRFADAQ